MRRPVAWCAAGGVMILAGCTTTAPDLEPVAPIEHTREILVQTIPRGGYVERNHEYIGMAPIAVKVRTTERGDLLRTTRITATDTPTGSWVEKLLMPGEPAPERMLMDVRPYLPRPDVLQF